MSYSNHVYLHSYCSLFIPYFNIIFVQYKNNFFSFFFSLLSLSNTNASHQVSASLSLFHSWALPLIFSLHLLLISFCSFSSPREIMWSVWGFCSPVRKVDQLIDSSFLLTDFGDNFSKKVWVFVIEILGFFCLLVSSKILGSFSKVRFEFTVWISKLWLLGKKKKMTIGRGHWFCGGRWSHYYNNRPTGDGGTMVKDTSLVGGHQSHYFSSLGIGGIRRSRYFNNPPIGGSLFSDIVGGETNPAAFAKATILAV